MFRTLVVTGCITLLSACTTLSNLTTSDLAAPGSSAGAGPAPAGAPAGFRFGEGDLMHVKVYREQELSGEYMVDPDGSIHFPLAGRIHVRGLTPNEVGDVLKRALADGYIRAPQIAVRVKEVNSRRVSVLGQVAKPGTFAYQDRMTLVEAITRAGGLTKLAQPRRVKITRRTGDTEQRFVIALDRILEGDMPNLALNPGDVVFVPESLF